MHFLGVIQATIQTYEYNSSVEAYIKNQLTINPKTNLKYIICLFNLLIAHKTTTYLFKCF